MVWCIFPSPKTQDPPWKETDYLQCHYPKPDKTLRGLITQEIGSLAELPGRSIVVCRSPDRSLAIGLAVTINLACGDAAFTKDVRYAVMGNTSLEVVEVEFQPRDMKALAHHKCEDAEVGNGLPEAVTEATEHVVPKKGTKRRIKKKVRYYEGDGGAEKAGRRLRVKH